MLGDERVGRSVAVPDKEISGTQFGPLLTDRGVTFRVWAPAAREVDLVLDRKMSMGKDGEWFGRCASLLFIVLED